MINNVLFVNFDNVMFFKNKNIVNNGFFYNNLYVIIS